jgi:hypothetical protein
VKTPFFTFAREPFNNFRFVEPSARAVAKRRQYTFAVELCNATGGEVEPTTDVTRRKQAHDE